MRDEDKWRERLAALVGESMRATSLRANLGPGYVHSIIKGGKDPSVSRLLAITHALRTPVVSLFEEEDKQEARRRLARIAGTLPLDQIEALERMALSLQGAPLPMQPRTEDQSGKS